MQVPYLKPQLNYYQDINVMTSMTDQVYQAIYEEIINGTLHPNQKLHIAQLAEKFDVGLSPIREALSRLIATNLVIAISQRGFKVASISREDLDDIYTTRTFIEKIALKLSIEKGDENWEGELISAFHCLSHTESKMDQLDFTSYQRWEKHHRAFNLKLIGACGLNHLLQIQEKLYHETERYRRIWVFAGMQENRVLKFSVKQKALMEAALARDTEKATHLLEEHFAHAKKLIAQYL